MDKQELEFILGQHKLWLNGEGGKKANLSWANLSGANLYGANLSEANLSRANLSWANLTDLQSASLSIIPDEGDIIGWKKCKGGIIVKLLIKSGTKRSNSTGRKCRAESVTVLEVIGGGVGISKHDNKTEYVAGSIVNCDKWDNNRWEECTGGIHFFITRAEAENY